MTTITAAYTKFLADPADSPNWLQPTEWCYPFALVLGADQYAPSLNTVELASLLARG